MTDQSPAGLREDVENWLTRWLVVFANRVQYVTLATRATRLRETVAEAQSELEAILALIPQPAQVQGEETSKLIDRAQRAIKLGNQTGADGDRRFDTNIYVIASDLLAALMSGSGGK